jgi:hypothetical protein
VKVHRASRVVVSLTGSVAVLALASSASAQGPVAHERPTGETKRAILDYWTAERIRRAESRDAGVVLTPTREPQGQKSSVRGRPHYVPPAEPTVNRQRMRSDASSSTAPQAFGTYEVLDYDVDPNTVHGKVLATDRGGNYDCSATAVNSANLSVVFTAAHCVRTKRFGWAQDFIFIPSYFQGQQPFGAWVWDALLTPSKWLERRRRKRRLRENPNFDFAAVVLAPQNGVPVVDAVGGAGFAWNEPRGVQPFRAFGYPGNFFDAQRMMACFSPPLRGPDFGRGPPTVGITCGMREGASGGGWLIEDEFLNSVTSGVLKGTNFVVGPYFGNAAAGLLGQAEQE